MDADTEPTDHAAADAAFHDATAHLYDDTLAPIFRVYIELMVEPWVRALPGTGSALDVGCGTGEMAAHLARRGYSVSGIDHSAGMLDVARRTLGDAAELTQGDVQDLPYPDRSFDVVACKGVLHHLPTARPCLDEIVRVLKPGGSFYFADPAIGSTPVIAAVERLTGKKGRPDATTEGHAEGPVSVPALCADLDDLPVQYAVRWWSQLPGTHRLPYRAQKALVSATSGPWRHRNGNMVSITGRVVA